MTDVVMLLANRAFSQSADSAICEGDRNSSVIPDLGAIEGSAEGREAMPER